MLRYAGLEHRYFALVDHLNLQQPAVLHSLIAVSVLRQQLRLFVGRQLVAVYPVSTSAHGIGAENDSACTPPGWHLVERKFGHQAPAGTIWPGGYHGREDGI